MRRYVTMRAKPRADAFDDLLNAPVLPCLTVYEADNDPVPTGLLDRHGNELYAFEDKPRIGFVWRD